VFDGRRYGPVCHQTLPGDSSLSTSVLFNYVMKGLAHMVGTGLISGGMRGKVAPDRALAAVPPTG